MGLVDFYSGRKILVTGGTGYFGSVLTEKLQALGSDVELVCRNPPPHFSKNGVRISIGDYQSLGSWTKWLKHKDVVFHLAAQTSHRASNERPIEDYNLNVFPLIRMLQSCQTKGIQPRIVFASTASVYGLCGRFPVSERMPVNPMTVYDVHKLACENYLQYAATERKISTVSLRIANVYGPSSAVSKADRGVLNHLAREAVRGVALKIYGSGK